jgi:hypothetical protein
MMEKKRKQACGCKPEKHNSNNNLQPMSGCWLQALCLWLQAREAQQQQQPTTNERLMAASQQHQRGNNLQPSSGCWLQEQEHHTRQRDIEAPMSGCWLQVSNTREATTYSQ